MEVLAHYDADGVSATHLLKVATGDVDRVIFPERFGDYRGVSDEKESTMVDMKPRNPEYSGFVYDHHPGHPIEADRKYTLVWRTYPTAKIIFEEFKDKIPKEEWWKVACGCVGDGQPYEIPVEVIQEEPSLLLFRSNLYSSYGKVSKSEFPYYLSLSSPINSACRVNQPGLALSCLANAEKPIDLIRNSSLIKAAAKIRSAESSVLRSGDYREIENQVVYFTFSNEFNIGSRAAAKLQDSFRRTAVVINTDKMAFSIRGILSQYLIEYFRPKGYDIGGHLGFSGGSLTKAQLVTFEEDIKTAIKELLG